METTTNNGYTQISNQLLEAIIGGAFTPAGGRILLHAIRKTEGYHKDHDQISLTQFEKATNLSRKSVTKELERLKLVNLITLVHKGNSKKASNDWIIDLSNLTSKLVNYSKLVTLEHPTSNLHVQELVTRSTHTKENIQNKITKERETQTFSDVEDRKPLKTENPRASVSYLENIPETDVLELSQKFILRESTIREVGESAASWVKSKGKEREYKDFKEMLKGWIDRDITKIKAKDEQDELDDAEMRSLQYIWTPERIIDAAMVGALMPGPTFLSAYKKEIDQLTDEQQKFVENYCNKMNGVITGEVVSQ